MKVGHGWCWGTLVLLAIRVYQQLRIKLTRPQFLPSESDVTFLDQIQEAAGKRDLPTKLPRPSWTVLVMLQTTNGAVLPRSIKL